MTGGVSRSPFWHGAQMRHEVGFAPAPAPPRRRRRVFPSPARGRPARSWLLRMAAALRRGGVPVVPAGAVRLRRPACRARPRPRPRAPCRPAGGGPGPVGRRPAPPRRGQPVAAATCVGRRGGVAGRPTRGAGRWRRGGGLARRALRRLRRLHPAAVRRRRRRQLRLGRRRRHRPAAVVVGIRVRAGGPGTGPAADSGGVGARRRRPSRASGRGAFAADRALVDPAGPRGAVVTRPAGSRLSRRSGPKAT